MYNFPQTTRNSMRSKASVGIVMLLVLASGDNTSNQVENSVYCSSVFQKKWLRAQRENLSHG